MQAVRAKKGMLEEFRLPDSEVFHEWIEQGERLGGCRVWWHKIQSFNVIS